MRVNARFVGVAEKQIEYLAKASQTTVSEVLRLSVDAYYQQQRGQTPALRNFAKHIGTYSYSPNVPGGDSRDYKAAVADAIEAKHSRIPRPAKPE